jgi:antibiotic biosynthesis monooxygenase (ABM) superfamily enzyme
MKAKTGSSGSGGTTSTTGTDAAHNGPVRVAPTAPPRWKFVVVVWLAIYPSLTLVLWLFGPTIAGWPIALRTLTVTALLVPWMVFFMLPVLQRLLASWLLPARNR